MRIMTASEAIDTYIRDGCTIAFGGFVGTAHPEEISSTIEKKFLEEGHPKDLNIIYAAGMGNSIDKGLNHLGHEGLVASAIGGHWGLVPRLQELAIHNKMAAYNIPQGVITQMYRDIAAGKPGLITHVGLGTFVDPRLEGGKINDKAREKGDIVEVIDLAGEEKLFYKAQKIEVAVIRATFADTKGNCTMQHEGATVDGLSIAQAARNCGGKVIVQVKQVVEFGSLDSRLVKIPGIYVDALVVAEPENHMQTFGTYYNPAYSGETRVPLGSLKPLALNERKVIARRAAFELVPNAVVNLGIGIPEAIASVAAEEGIEDLVLTTESGTIGGIPAAGNDFGVTTNPECVLDQPYQFDFYDGGGLDLAYLGLAQMDRHGNINVSKFGTKLPGCGGFINITQNAKKVVFCGTFTASGLKTQVSDGKLNIIEEGKRKKIINDVEQISFSGNYAVKSGQKVLYITERAVFELTSEGIELKEVAPGVDIDKDILANMDFVPVMKNVKTMDERIFKNKKMYL